MTGRRDPAAPWWSRPECLAAGAVLGVAVAAWVGAGDLAVGTLSRPGPGFFPRVLAALLGGLAAALLLRGIREPAPSVGALWPDRSGRRRVLGLALLLVGWVALVEAAGYLLTTALFVALMLRGLGGRGWGMSVAVSLAAAGGSYLLFARWLAVSLPRGALLP